MTTWSEAIKARLMAYCRIDVLEDGEEDLLKTLYLSAVAYLAGADISEPEADTPRRAQYDLCVNALVLDAYDKRGTTVSGSALTDNREYRGTFLQLQATEPASESDTQKGPPRRRPGRRGNHTGSPW